MLRPLLRRSSALIAVCDYEVEQFARRLKVDPQKDQAHPKWCRTSPCRRLSVPGTRLAAYKLRGTVGALQRSSQAHCRHAVAPRDGAGARLVVVGRGSYERQLRRLVIRLGVERAVTFTSFDAANRAALGTLIRSSDIVALLSDYEANPVALMEALALGRKIVVADTSGLSELASEGLAIAVPPKASPNRTGQNAHRRSGGDESEQPRAAHLGTLRRPTPPGVRRGSPNPDVTATLVALRCGINKPLAGRPERSSARKGHPGRRTR